MPRGEAWSAVALALVALLAVAQSWRLGVGPVTRPGPGFFPLLLAAALGLVAVALLVRAVQAPAAPLPAGPTVPRRLGVTLGALAAYVIAFERLGFVLATVGFLAFLFAVLGRYRWPVALVIAAGVAAGAWVLFDTWLQVRLPAGVLGRW
jgi:putative tricarboxylic transport membrane protein